MALTAPPKIKKIRPRLTDEQKSARRDKFVALTNDVEQARSMYSNKIQNISKKHGWYVFLNCYMDFNTLLLLGLSAGLLASCSSVTSRVLAVDPTHGTVLFVSA